MCTVSECNYKQMSQDKKHAYITIDDFHSMGKDMRDQTLLAIKAPPDTLLEVPRGGENKVCVLMFNDRRVLPSRNY